MKTKELIRRLQEADPSGELECCVDNHDILTVYQVEAYFDGRLEVLHRDASNPYYNVTGARIAQRGHKVVIQPHSIEDALCDNPALPVEVEGEPNGGRYTKQVAKWRYEAEAAGLPSS